MSTDRPTRDEMRSSYIDRLTEFMTEQARAFDDVLAPYQVDDALLHPADIALMEATAFVLGDMLGYMMKEPQKNIPAMVHLISCGIDEGADRYYAERPEAEPSIAPPVAPSNMVH